MSRYLNCEGVSRRDCLKLGLGGLFGAGLVDMLRLSGQASGKTIAPSLVMCSENEMPGTLVSIG